MDNLAPGCYDQCMRPLERLSIARLRRQLLAGARGSVLEVGAGTGANLAHYPAHVSVTGVDLRPAHLVAAARKVGRHSPRPSLTLACANAESMPFATGAFDMVVGSLVFCSIHDPLAALAEIKRVLRPGGQLHLLEHVRGLTPLSQRLTDWLHPLWFALQGECHLNRETAATVAAAGFAITHTSQHARGVLQLIEAVAPP